MHSSWVMGVGLDLRGKIARQRRRIDRLVVEEHDKVVVCRIGCCPGLDRLGLERRSTCIA